MNQLANAAKLLALSLPLALATAAAAQPYAYTVIDVPGASTTVANGINDLGHIVGTFSDGTGAHGFVYNGASFLVVDVPGASWTAAWGINDTGDVVGTFDDTKGRHGFLRSGATFTTIDHPGAAATWAWDINNLGQIVGGYYFVNGADVQGYLKTGPTFNGVTVPGFAFSEAVGINSAGDVVGTALANVAPTAIQHGFVMTGAAATVLDVPGASITNADGINDAGHIVGAYADAAGIGHGFLKIGNTFFDIDAPGATSETAAFGINNRGLIVGEFYDATGYHGFLATPVSEPASAMLLAAGLATLLGASRWRRAVVRRSARAGTLQPRGSASPSRSMFSAALTCGLVLGSALPAMAAVKAAYVETVLPSKPFKLTVNARHLLYEDVFILGDGAFGITSITATNQENVPRTLVIYEPSAAIGRGCGTPTSTTYSNLPVVIPAMSTVQLTFPGPLVFSAVNGRTCARIYLNENTLIQVLLNGVSN